MTSKGHAGAIAYWTLVVLLIGFGALAILRSGSRSSCSGSCSRSCRSDAMRPGSSPPVSARSSGSWWATSWSRRRVVRPARTPSIRHRAHRACTNILGFGYSGTDTDNLERDPRTPRRPGRRGAVRARGAMARPADRLAPYTSSPGAGVTPTIRSATADDIPELARLRWQLYTERETHDEPFETYVRAVRGVRARRARPRRLASLVRRGRTATWWRRCGCTRCLASRLPATALRGRWAT